MITPRKSNSLLKGQEAVSLLVVAGARDHLKANSPLEFRSRIMTTPLPTKISETQPIHQACTPMTISATIAAMVSSMTSATSLFMG